MNDPIKANTLAGIKLNRQSQHLWQAVVAVLNSTISSPGKYAAILDSAAAKFANNDCEDDAIRSNGNNVHPNYYADEGTGHHDLAFHEDQMFPKDWIIGTCVITAFKYLKRFKSKNGVEDLKKARTYIDRLINLESDSEN